MKPIRSLFRHLIPRRKVKRDVRLRISNLTRKSELATCAEVADDGAKRRKGLLGRQGLAPGEGLWILPCEAIHTFGMQFPIDLVYLDRKMCVRKVKVQVRPWRLSACLSAHSVLELAPGTIRATQTRPGDVIQVSSTTPPEDHSAAFSSPLLATEIS
jgi:uncharacterized membrane protein (UPF0127 family)